MRVLSPGLLPLPLPLPTHLRLPSTPAHQPPPTGPEDPLPEELAKLDPQLIEQVSQQENCDC